MVYREVSLLQRRQSRFQGIYVAGASQSDTSTLFRVSGPGSKNLRVDFILGRVDITTASTVQIQDTSGYGLWNDVTAAISGGASTDRVIASYTGGVLTLAGGHGFSEGDAVGCSAAVMPAGLSNKIVYYIINLATNDCQLTTIRGDAGHIVDALDAGTTGVLTAAKVVSVRINSNENDVDPSTVGANPIGVADTGSYENVLPLRPSARCSIATTHANDIIQVLDIVIMQD